MGISLYFLPIPINWSFHMKDALIQKLFKKYNFKTKDVFKCTLLDGVKLVQINHHEETRPLLYKRGILFIASGEKRGFLGDEEVTIGNDNFIIVTALHPVECETFTFDRTITGLYIELDMTRVQKITTMIDNKSKNKSSKMPQNVMAGNMSDELNATFYRLMNILLDSQDSKVLGEAILDEICYRVFQSPAGKHLMQLCTQNSHFSKILHAVDDIQNHLEESITIEELVRKTDMSKASFHRRFKEIFNDSPIQYIKKVKLNKAREYILFEKMKIVDAAYKVGYESPAQFSREFKTQFGFPPSNLKKIII